MSEFEGLRAAAEAATPGWAEMPARVDIDREGACDGCAAPRRLIASYPEPDNEPWLCDECAAEVDFITAANPTAVLALIERVEAAEEDAAKLRILAAATIQALARVQTLADEWERDPYCDADVTYGSAATDLRAAIDGDA